MKRMGMAVWVLMLISGTTAWAQTEPTAAAAGQERANLKGLFERARQDKLVLLQLAPNPQTTPPRATVTPPVPLSTPFGTVQSYSFGQNRLTISTQSDDPLASLQVAPGAWWNTSDMITLLSLTKDQQKKMDDIFQQHRIKLIDLNASLSREEAILDPLIAAENSTRRRFWSRSIRLPRPAPSWKRIIPDCCFPFDSR